MKRFRMASAGVAATLLLGTNVHSAPNYQDAWWDAAQSGMGVMILHQGDTVAAAWYFFGSDTKATYLLLSGPLSNNSLSGGLRRAAGPQPGPGFSSSLVTENTIGTATLTFTSNTTANLAYSFDGLSGTLPLTRMSIGQPNFNGSADFVIQSVRDRCTMAANNMSGASMGRLTSVRTGDSLVLTTAFSGGWACTYSTTLSQSGSTYAANGTFSCASGQLGGTASFSEIRLAGDFLTANYTASYTHGESCQESGRLAGTLSR